MIGNGNTTQMKPQYYPGKLVVLANEYFNKQKQLKEENDIKQWKAFVERFFNEKCIYCMMLSRDNKEWTFSKYYCYYYSYLYLYNLNRLWLYYFTDGL